MKKNLIVLQDGYKECGAACLLSIIRYYDGNISINKLVELTKTTKTGTHFYNLKEASTTIGLNSKAYKIDNINSLLDLNLPFICQFLNNNYEHFIVVYQIKKDKVIIMDPAIGKRTLTIDQFSKLWTGYIMMFSPSKKLPIYIDEKYLNKVIIETIKNSKSIVINILLLSIIFTIMSCLYAFYGKIIIDKIINTNTSNLLLITFIFSIIVLIKCLANFIRTESLIYLNQKIDCSLFLKTFKKILLLPYNYYKNKTTGEMISRINDLATVKNLLSKVILTVLLDIIISLVCSILLFNISKKMFTLTVIIILEYLFIYYFFRPIVKKYINILQENNAQINSTLVENISGFETIKNLNIEEEIKKKTEKLYVSSLNDAFNYDNLSNLEAFLKDIITIIGTLLISYVGYRAVMKNELTIGSVVTYLSLMPYFIDPLKNLVDLSKELFYAINSIKRVNNLFDIEEEKLTYKTNLKINGNIKISNLTFSYNNKDNVLNNINTNIEKGNKVLILGESGSGKSTILRLLYKYYKIRRDTIYIDDIDINDYSLEDIRSNIVYISQEETIFTDTIKNNIILDRNINYENFIEICNLTYVNEITKKLFIEYDTKLEENGLNISGGQRQRIILARALLKKSSIILIDEGLNAVDINLERKILKNIFNKYKDKTIIIVSHRLANIDLYDRVLRIEQGHISDEYSKQKGDINDWNLYFIK